MTNKQFKAWLKEKRACQTAVDWVGDRDAAAAWMECKRSDWMLWWAGMCRVKKAPLVCCAVRFARSVLHLVPVCEDSSRLAIEAAEAWQASQTEKNRVAAREAAEAASISSQAALSAGWAATAAGAKGAVAPRAAYAASTAERAAVAVPWAWACKIIREEIPFADVLRGMQK